MGRDRNGTSASSARKRETPLRELLADNLPPQNLDAERAVLGSVLRDNFCMNEVVKTLQVDHFYSAKHRKIFETMRAMFEEAKPIDGLTLGEELAQADALLEVGGAPAILEIVEQTLTAANVGHYSKIVHDKGVIRNLIHTSTEILRDAYEGAGSADDLLEDAEKKIFAIVDRQGAADAVEISLVLSMALDRIDERKKNDGQGVAGIPSGFLDLDELTNGWQNSELIILAARPSMGKTALALNLVEHAAVDHEVPVLVVSLEMSNLELAERLLCSRSKVNGHSLRRGRIGSEEMQDLIHANEELSSSPIFIDDTPGQTMMRITATSRRLKHRRGLGMIIVDYMQLIEADDRKVSRQEQISTISRRLKNLARELQVPVVALSQLNRGAESREGHRPRMSDLRESGSIEQDADVVMLLHRDDAYDPQDNPGQADLILCKQRNGPVGDIKLSFLKDQTRFENFHTEVAPFGDGADGF